METFSALLAICAGNSPVPGEFPPQKPVTRSFNVYFDMRPNKRLSKQLWGWWFETQSCPLWYHRNVCPSWVQNMILFYLVPRNIPEGGQYIAMSWLCASPGHQPLWYGACVMRKFLIWATCDIKVRNAAEWKYLFSKNSGWRTVQEGHSIWSANFSLLARKRCA